MVCLVGSALIDRRTARLAVALAVAGSLMLTAGLGIWAVSALSHAIPHAAHTVAWLAAVALLTAGICCGVLMIVVLVGSGRRTADPAGPSWRDPRLRGPRPPEQPAASGAAQGARPMLDMWPEPGPWPGSGPDEWPIGTELPPEAEPAPGGWSSADPDHRPDAAVAPDAYQWSAPDGGFVPQPEPAADDWSEVGSELRPGAVLGQGEWIVREHEPAAGPDAGLEPGADAGLLPPAGLAPGPAAGQPARDDPDDGPVHRVESEFNVWQRPGPGAAPDAGPAAPAAEVAPPDAAFPDAAFPDAGPQPAGGWLPPAQEVPAEPAADVLEPAADLADQDRIRRPAAPRRSGPAPGWNPDSEEDWLRVLRGLRASEDS